MFESVTDASGQKQRSTAPPSVLPDISPTGGEIGSFAFGALLRRLRLAKAAVVPDLPPRGGDVR
ncbi:hypothetical protein X748_01050 [Mesorhizobium sp. LNJC386A00]|nr:hypothetical protein X748_01050 [Mesorhizobium sp. LNJC386A00]